MEFKKGETFHLLLGSGKIGVFITMDIEGVTEEEIAHVMMELYELPVTSVGEVNDFWTGYYPEFHEIEEIIKNPLNLYSEYLKEVNRKNGRNEWDGIPKEAYVTEIKPEEIYRVFIDKKKNEVEIILKHGEHFIFKHHFS